MPSVPSNLSSNNSEEILLAKSLGLSILERDTSTQDPNPNEFVQFSGVWDFSHKEYQVFYPIQLEVGDEINLLARTVVITNLIQVDNINYVVFKDTLLENVYLEKLVKFYAMNYSFIAKDYGDKLAIGLVPEYIVVDKDDYKDVEIKSLGDLEFDISPKGSVTIEAINKVPDSADQLPSSDTLLNNIPLQLYIGDKKEVKITSLSQYTLTSKDTNIVEIKDNVITGKAEGYATIEFATTDTDKSLDVISIRVRVFKQVDNTGTTVTKNYQEVQFNNFNSDIEIEGDKVNFYSAITDNAAKGLTGPSVISTLSSATLKNLAQGTILILEYNPQTTAYSGVFFNDDAAGNITFVKGVTKNLNQGSFDAANISLGTIKGINLDGKDLVIAESNGVYTFSVDNAEWFKVDLNTFADALKSNGVPEGNIVRKLGFYYGYSATQRNKTLATIKE